MADASTGANRKSGGSKRRSSGGLSKKTASKDSESFLRNVLELSAKNKVAAAFTAAASEITSNKKSSSKEAQADRAD